MNGLIVLLTLEIALFLLAFLLSGQDIMAPSVMMCIMFILSTSVTLINANRWEIEYSSEAVLILSTGIATFIFGEVFYRFIWCRQLRGKVHCHEEQAVTVCEVRAWKLNLLIIFDAFVCMWNMIMVLSQVNGGSLPFNSISKSFLLYRRLGSSSLATTGQSMSSGPILNQLLKIVIASGYLSSYFFINNLIFGRRKRTEQLKHVIIMIMSLLPSIMSAGRSGILRLTCAFLIEYYIVWHQKVGWNRNLSWKYIKYGLIGLVIAIPSFYYSAELLGRKPGAPLFDYMSEYLGASIQLFNLYIKEPVARNMMGEESLFSVLKVLHFLGLCDASTSYNLEFRSLVTVSSNVYTFFRRPLHDFGLLGMYIFTVMVAMLFSWVYYKKIKYREKSQSAMWVLLYGFFYYWIVASSILQYSVAYISAGVFITVSIMLLMYRLMVSTKGKK